MGVDLSRIEAWTRGMLEAEARRRGIRGTEFRTRGELVRLILRHQYGDQLNAGREGIAKGRRAVKEARELFGAVLGAAISALPTPGQLLGRVRSTLPGAPSPAPGRVPHLRTRGDAPGPARVPREAVRIPDPAWSEDPGLTGEMPGRSAHPAVPPPAPQAVPPGPAAAPPQPAARASEPSTRTFLEEPIRTRSMAHLLAAQGHRERALAIYEELLGQNSEDASLHAEAAAVRRGEAVSSLPEPPANLERASAPDGGDRLRCEGEAVHGFELEWRITDAGMRRARAVLGCEGELAVRVINVRPDPDRIVRSEVTEHGPVREDGSWRCPALPSSTRCLAAVGLRNGDRFVAIVHASPAGRRPELGASASA